MRLLPRNVSQIRRELAYYERIVETSRSADRVARAHRAIARLTAQLARVEAERRTRAEIGEETHETRPRP